jgi:4-carboxymuconolactone decarboxylase
MKAPRGERVARITKEEIMKQATQNISMVAPALEKYARGPIADLWKRPGLEPRDRSVVTVAALIARNQTIEMPQHFNLALDNGVKPGELSEIITHLAFYSGWASAASAVAITKDLFDRRGIGPDEIPPASPELLPLNEILAFTASHRLLPLLPPLKGRGCRSLQ